MVRMSRLRVIEIGVAVMLTAAALLFVALKVWAAEPGITVTDAWARPTIGEGRTTAAYMTITNKGADEDSLQSARSARAKAVELHQTKMSAAGVMQMRKVEDGLSIPANGVAKLAAGGIHVMVMGLDNALAAGDELPLTLQFAKAGAIDIAVPVSAAAPADHSHH
jgi:periplasmic copper chaperone A